MIRAVLVCSALLAAQGAGPPASEDREKPSPPPAEAAVNPSEALAQYNALREKTPETSAAQWKLALWCEQHGLKAEAYTHLTAVVRLDPKRDAAWRKLGYKKTEGRWLTDEQIAEDKELKAADKVWTPLLKHYHKAIHGARGVKKQAEAQEALDAISDPKAIAAVYREFGAGGPHDQEIAVQVLGQIDRPLSSKVLATMAVYGKTPEVRRRATETLRGRPADDFLGLLVSLMVDPLEYEVKAVGGPGSPGVLFVQGERFNTRRFYAAPAPPNVAPMPGDVVSYDQFGMPVISRAAGPMPTQTGVPGSKGLAYRNSEMVQFSATRNLIEAGRVAASAQAQLENDVAQLESVNRDRKNFNELVMAVATDATGKDRGSTAKQWRDALAAENKYARAPTRTPRKPTYDELVPSAYRPVYSQLVMVTTIVKSSSDP